MREPAYRLYNCERCQVQVRICERCDHGNVYCAGECAKIRRRESQRRSQARYQRSHQGARRHAARQRRWRERQRQKLKIVTHQGSPVAVSQCIVALSAIIQSQPIDASACVSEQLPKIRPPLECCAFCGALLPDWTRQRPWRWSG
jgi:hypothetical protein